MSPDTFFGLSLGVLLGFLAGIVVCCALLRWLYFGPSE
jgi:hypothetical protein